MARVWDGLQGLLLRIVTVNCHAKGMGDWSRLEGAPSARPCARLPRPLHVELCVKLTLAEFASVRHTSSTGNSTGTPIVEEWA